MLRRLDLVEQALAELDAVIAEACRPWQHQIELLQTIPGVGPKVAETIVAETGADMTRFPTAAHLAAWAGVAPAMNESAGRQSPAGKRHGNKWLTAMLVEAAGSVGRMHGKNYLAAQHARLTRRRGMGRAQVAVAHSILVAAYWMLKRDEPYHDLGADWHSRRNDEAHTRRGVRPDVRELRRVRVADRQDPRRGRSGRLRGTGHRPDQGGWQAGCPTAWLWTVRDGRIVVYHNNDLE
jgi:hypothetical protein